MGIKIETGAITEGSFVSVSILTIVIGCIVGSMLYIFDVSSRVTIIESSRAERIKVTDTTVQDLKEVKRDVSEMKADVAIIKTLLELQQKSKK
jgi:hypothetical protein